MADLYRLESKFRPIQCTMLRSLADSLIQKLVERYETWSPITFLLDELNALGESVEKIEEKCQHVLDLGSSSIYRYALMIRELICLLVWKLSERS